MSIIQSLTQNQPSNTKQLNLSSTLPTKIYKIQCLNRFNNLRKLNLSNNCIQKIQNISHLTQLKVLNLQFNQLTVLQNIQNLKNLEEILLSYNSIQFINPKIQLNQKIKVLNLGFNQIKTIDALMPVFSLQKLVVLSIHGNPFINTLNYMVFIKLLVPDLLYLDEKDLNNTNLQGELYPQQEVAILRDTLNKLLQQRNYLAQQLQNLTNISSPTKINLKDYLKNHQQNYGQQQNSFSNSNIKVATFSPIKIIKNSKHQGLKSRVNRSINEEDSSLLNQNIQTHNNKGVNQRQKMLQILKYWLKKLEDKIGIKKSQSAQLHEYYTNKIKQKQHKSSIFEQKLSSKKEDEQYKDIERQLDIKQKISSKDILKQIKQKQQQLNEYKLNIKSIKSLIQQINSLPPHEQMYKVIMLRILFGGNISNQNINRNKSKNTKRQLNYRQLKHFLLSQYGILNALNDLNRLVFGVVQFSIQRVNELRQWINNKSLLDIVNEAKNKMRQLKRQKKLFNRQRQQYMIRIQQQSRQIESRWIQLNDNKRRFEFEKGKQIKYQNKLLQLKQSQLSNKLQQYKLLQKKNIQVLLCNKQQICNNILRMQQNLQQLEQKYERRYLQLQQFEKQFNIFKQEKQNMVRMQQQLKVIKKQLFQKQNILQQTNEKLKQLSLNEQINSQRLKFLQRKCYQKSQQIKSLNQQQTKIKQKIIKYSQQQNIHLLQLSNINNKLSYLSEQEKSIHKNIQRHRGNLTIYQQKMRNLSELQVHKKKSIQQLQLKIQQQKSEYIRLNEKNIQLQQILATKQQSIHSYMLKISQHKKSLQSYKDISKNIQQLIDKQCQLKRNILELQIQNGNLIDLKNQLIRQLKQNQFSNFNINKSKHQWMS